ncbi:MAG: hypothetical protein JSS95_08950 [Acidobacteria bacterium]|nr:hypothetical protein [Acidobacteriota bacterium]
MTHGLTHCNMRQASATFAVRASQLCVDARRDAAHVFVERTCTFAARAVHNAFIAAMATKLHQQCKRFTAREGITKDTFVQRIYTDVSDIFPVMEREFRLLHHE